MLTFYSNTVMLDPKETAVERCGVVYEVVYGNGTPIVSTERVIVDDETTDLQSILDMAIDQIAEREPELLYTIYEAETKNPEGDLYISGGNEGLCLFHYGTLDIILAA